MKRKSVSTGQPSAKRRNPQAKERVAGFAAPRKDGVAVVRVKRPTGHAGTQRRKGKATPR